MAWRRAPPGGGLRAGPSVNGFPKRCGPDPRRAPSEQQISDPRQKEAEGEHAGLRKGGYRIRRRYHGRRWSRRERRSTRRRVGRSAGRSAGRSVRRGGGGGVRGGGGGGRGGGRWDRGVG